MKSAPAVPFIRSLRGVPCSLVVQWAELARALGAPIPAMAVSEAVAHSDEIAIERRAATRSPLPTPCALGYVRRSIPRGHRRPRAGASGDRPAVDACSSQ